MALPEFMGGDDLDRKLDRILELLEEKGIGQKEGFTPTPGSFMGRVDQAGGIDAYEEQKAKALEAMAKIKPEQWKGINANLSLLKDFIDLDAPGIFRQMKFSITETVSLKMQELFSPLKNEINAQINDILNPFIAEYLSPIMADLSGFLAANPEAAAAGGIVGSIGGMFLPGGDIWTVLIALVTAGTLEALNTMFPDFVADKQDYQHFYSSHMSGYKAYISWNPGASFQDYMAWLKSKEGPGGDSYAPDPYDRAPSGRPIY